MLSSTNLKDWIFPFSNLSDFFKSLLVISKFKTANLMSCRKIELIISEKISQTSLKHFISRVTSFPHMYDLNFWKHLPTLESQINDLLESNNENVCEFLCELRNCIFCNDKLNSEADIYYNGRVYFYGKPSQSCYIGLKKCKHCRTEHYLSYADVPNKGRIFYKNIIESKFISFTNQTVFEKLFICSIKIDFFFKHSSFLNICQHHNQLFNVNNENYRNNLNEKRLAETWYQFNLIMFDIEYDLNPDDQIYGKQIQYLDESIYSRRKYFLPFFIKKWTSTAHSSSCKNVNCSHSVNVDGNWKCFRLKCAYEDAYLVSDELNPIQTGCTETPERGSYYCSSHSSMQEKVFFRVNNENWQFDAMKIKSDIKGTMANKNLKIHDYFENHNRVMYYLLTNEGKKIFLKNKFNI